MTMLREELAKFDDGIHELAAEAPDRADTAWLFRMWWSRLWQFFYADGPHPGVVIRRVFMLARRYAPELILHMNGTDLGIMWGDTRAAQSHRINVMFDGLRSAGVRGNRGGGCKREGTRKTFAKSATGNQNRKKTGRNKRTKQKNERRKKAPGNTH